MSEHERTSEKAQVRPDLTREISESVFASSGAAERSIERAASKTRTGARLIAADHIHRLLAFSTLIITRAFKRLTRWAKGSIIAARPSPE
jgi:hypothetical protein